MKHELAYCQRPANNIWILKLNQDLWMNNIYSYDQYNFSFCCGIILYMCVIEYFGSLTVFCSHLSYGELHAIDVIRLKSARHSANNCMQARGKTMPVPTWAGGEIKHSPPQKKIASLSIIDIDWKILWL